LLQYVSDVCPLKEPRPADLPSCIRIITIIAKHIIINAIIRIVFNTSMTGYLEVPADGIYTFALLSDDGSTLTLDGELLGDNDGPSF
jgi:hypothetical protein